MQCTVACTILVLIIIYFSFAKYNISFIFLFVNNLLSVLLLDIKDIEKHFPGLLKATVEWLKIYKIPDGKPENKFAFNGEPKNTEFALKIVSDAHEYWKGLLLKEDTEGISW